MPSLFGLFSHWRNNEYRSVPNDESSNERFEDEIKFPSVIDPWLYNISPLVGWLTPIIVTVKKPNFFGTENLPLFSRNAEHLRKYAEPLLSGHYSPFLFQYEIAGKIVLSGVLELVSNICILASPMILREFLKSPDSLQLVLVLSAVNVLSSITGRAKDQIVRVQSEELRCMLQAAVFEKSLKLSSKARLMYPASKIINISSSDVEALRSYAAKVHDLWSSLFQIISIAVLIFLILDISSFYGFATIIFLLSIQIMTNTHNANIIKNIIINNDQRIKILREFLYHAKGVKVLALEKHFISRISEIRDIQLGWVKRWLTLSFALFSCLNQMTSVLSATITFVAFWYQGHQLTASNVFPTLALFELIRVPAFKVSLSLTQQFTVVPSFKRVAGLLAADEDIPLGFSSFTGSENSAITFENAEFRYAKLEHDAAVNNASEFVLGPLNFQIPKDKLTMCVGPIAGGKSSLLNAVIGVLEPKQQETLRIGIGTMALCTQDPWIKSGTVRENIIFYSEYNEERYRETLEMCCLLEDLESWGGDSLLIGEQGVNLSGGQRARVSLARAVYSEADILLLDDPLSAVDAHIGKRLFFDCIRRLPKTVLLVTHQVTFLSYVDNIIALRQGKLIEQGTPDLLFAKNDSFISSLIIPLDREIGEENTYVIEENERTKLESRKINTDSKQPAGQVTLVEEEERAIGSVRSDVYAFYRDCAGGWGILIVVLGTFSLSLGVRVFTSYYFVLWLGNTFGWSSLEYIWGYVSLTVVQSTLFILLATVMIRGSLKASKTIHESAIGNVITATYAYLQSQPVGRVLHRFQSDIGTVDTNLLTIVDGLFVAINTILASIIVILITVPYLIIIALPILAISYYVQQLYRVSARELRRLNTILISPTISVVSETLGAIPTVKAYKAEEHFRRQYTDFLDKTYAAKIVLQSLSTWITFRAEMISSLVLLTGGLLSYLGLISTLAAGLALSTAITFTKNIYLLLWAMIELEVVMNSVERLEEYVTKIPSEQSKNSLQVSVSWPENGEIKFSNVSLRYRTRADLALDSIDLTVCKCERIGIVGRTGSGKTTLVSTLSRLVDISTGNISIDGIDISSVPLEQLRRSVCVLPQESLLFEGSLKENLDPEGIFSDLELHHVLKLCGLTENFQTNGEEESGISGLDTRISSGGDNVSAGQKQLICIARVLLKRPKILIIDEATASIDFTSDKLIQSTLKTKFPSTTILCIAHRISTLVWMDRILVMEDGRIVEDGSPSDLLEQAGDGESRFRGLMRASGDDFLRKMIEEAREGQNDRKDVQGN